MSLGGSGVFIGGVGSLRDIYFSPYNLVPVSLNICSNKVDRP